MSLLHTEPAQLCGICCVAPELQRARVHYYGIPTIWRILDVVITKTRGGPGCVA
jgi:hypothetical protein